MTLLKTSWASLINMPFTSLPPYPHPPLLVTLLEPNLQVWTRCSLVHTDLTSWRQKHSWSVVWVDETQAYNLCPLSFKHRDHRTESSQIKASPPCSLPRFARLSHTPLSYRDIRNIYLVSVPGSWHRAP